MFLRRGRWERWFGRVNGKKWVVERLSSDVADVAAEKPWLDGLLADNAPVHR